MEFGRVIQKQYQLKSLNIKAMKKTSVIIIGLLSIFLMGCKTHCPEFPANLNYFPYHSGQELKFVNTQGVVRNFTIVNKENSKSESLEWNCKCICEAYSSFKTNENQDSLSIRETYLRFYDGEKYVSFLEIGFGFHHSYLYGESLTKRLDLEKPAPYNEIYKYLQDTIVIENDNNQLVKKIVVVKGKGLVSYTTADGEEWNLVE